MVNLARVYSKINNENISIFNYRIPLDTKAVVINTDNKYGIFVDYEKIETAEEEFTVMSHEYGHCKSGTTHKLNSKFDIIEKHEYRANRQSILTFLPLYKLNKAVTKGYTKAYEIAEYLNLPESFVTMAIRHYKCMGKI